MEKSRQLGVSHSQSEIKTGPEKLRIKNELDFNLGNKQRVTKIHKRVLTDHRIPRFDFSAKKRI